jgi:hypothetical protein
MNQIDTLNAMAGVAVAEVAAKESMIKDGTFILYRCALAGAELMEGILMSPNASRLFDLVQDGDMSEAFDKIVVLAEIKFGDLDHDYEIVIL